MADAVSAGTVAIVEEPVISPPADSTLSTSAVSLHSNPYRSSYEKS